MRGYQPTDSFDEEEADTYDQRSQRGDEDAAVAFLARWAGPGPALELAVGTGRIAVPLAATGVTVHGVDLSAPMVARLRAKPGGQRVAVTMGDMADVAVDGRFRLVYVVYNSLFNLLTQDDQVRCFANAARHLSPDGAFVVEAFVPSFLHRLPRHQYVEAEAVELNEVRLDVARHDPVAQVLVESHVSLTPQRGVRLNPVVTRYAWPAELDLMAWLAGLRLRERWGGWQGEPFTGDSDLHVSVWSR